MALIEVRDFSYTYPGVVQRALRKITLSIEEGAFVVVTGKSGCGKSTLGKALAGFLFQDEQPDYSGEIIVNNTAMAQVPLYTASERVAYVQQNPEDQFCTLTVKDEIAFGLENRCVNPTEIQIRIEQALTVVQGQDLIDRDLATLSGGEKQKVAIASMLALAPDVLILDEPTSNLDPIATQNVFASLYHLRESEKMTVIIIEHKLSQLAPLDPQVVVMDEGALQTITTITDFQNKLPDGISIDPDHKIRREPNASKPILALTDIHLTLDGNPILKDIDLNLFPGEFISLMGLNGSGKTTLLQTIMGFYPNATGKRWAFGQDLTRAKTSALVPHIGYLFQNPDHQLFTTSVWDEVVLTCANLGMLDESMKTQATKGLEALGLVARAADHPQRLSYGEKRRLNLLSAMLHEPQLLLIDELLIGQDLVNANQWMAVLSEYTLKGNTVLLINHHADLTQTYCTRVVFLDQGQVIVDSPTAVAFAQLADLGFGAFLPNPAEMPAYA